MTGCSNEPAMWQQQNLALVWWDKASTDNLSHLGGLRTMRRSLWILVAQWENSVDLWETKCDTTKGIWGRDRDLNLAWGLHLQTEPAQVTVASVYTRTMRTHLVLAAGWGRLSALPISFWKVKKAPCSALKMKIIKMQNWIISTLDTS